MIYSGFEGFGNHVSKVFRNHSWAMIPWESLEKRRNGVPVWIQHCLLVITIGNPIRWRRPNVSWLYNMSSDQTFFDPILWKCGKYHWTISQTWCFSLIILRARAQHHSSANAAQLSSFSHTMQKKRYKTSFSIMKARIRNEVLIYFRHRLCHTLWYGSRRAPGLPSKCGSCNLHMWQCAFMKPSYIVSPCLDWSLYVISQPRYSRYRTSQIPWKRQSKEHPFLQRGKL